MGVNMHEIVVNGKTKIVDKDLLSYTDVVAMTDLPYSPFLSIMYSKPPLIVDDGPKCGILSFHSPAIHIRDKTKFSVADTGNA